METKIYTYIHGDKNIYLYTWRQKYILIIYMETKIYTYIHGDKNIYLYTWRQKYILIYMETKMGTKPILTVTIIKYKWTW